LVLQPEIGSGIPENCVQIMMRGLEEVKSSSATGDTMVDSRKIPSDGDRGPG
jgi:hypothetical protein